MVCRSRGIAGYCMNVWSLLSGAMQLCCHFGASQNCHVCLSLRVQLPHDFVFGIVRSRRFFARMLNSVKDHSAT